MKKNFALIIFLLAVSYSLSAQTITVQLSGTVLRDSTHAPVFNHEVFIQADSNSYGFVFYATRYTGQNGFYDCTIHNVPTTGAGVTFIVKTKNCDSTWLIQTFVGNVTPDTVNFILCNENTTSCHALFSYSIDTSNLHLVQFTDLSTSSSGSIIAWHWDFGDGSPVSTLQNPSHQYAEYGIYTICLTIETSLGCTSNYCHEVHVGQSTECQAHYNFYADSVNVLHVHFWDTSTPLNTIVGRLWNFGDPESGTNNTSTNMDPWHIFSHAGVYNVCLTIETSFNCHSTFCDSITVGSNPYNCENWITYESSGLTFSFMGHTGSPYPTQYIWNFGDPQSGNNNVSTLQNPDHVFTSAGSYVITLHTIDSTGCEWNRTQTIYAHSTYDLYGTAFLSNDLTVDHGLAELIRVDSGLVVTVDSQEFGDSAGMYWFGGVLPGHYYIRATLLPSSAYYGQYLPTYYIDAAYWEYATLIGLGQPNNPYNIHMHHINGYAPGNGNINGTINQNGKYNGNGTPAANVQVMILDVSNQILAFTMTNTSGEFSFPEMALGTYKVYPEMIEKVTTPTTVTLDETHPDANVVFTIQGGNISGIHNETAQSDFVISNIYPNPVTDFANLTINTLHPNQISLSLYTITGEFVTEILVNLHQGANKIAIPALDLRKGLYYVKVEKPEGGVVVKKFILSR
jgi:PKD repeat protein